MLTQQEAFQPSPSGEEVQYCTLNKLIDSLVALRDKENAGDCPVMMAYAYDVEEPLISYMSKSTGQFIDNPESFSAEYTRTVVIEGSMY